VDGSAAEAAGAPGGLRRYLDSLSILFPDPSSAPPPPSILARLSGSARAGELKSSWLTIEQ
jgi:hypothetical protein